MRLNPICSEALQLTKTMWVYTYRTISATVKIKTTLNRDYPTFKTGKFLTLS